MNEVPFLFNNLILSNNKPVWIINQKKGAVDVTAKDCIPAESLKRVNQ